MIYSLKEFPTSRLESIFARAVVRLIRYVAHNQTSKAMAAMGKAIVPIDSDFEIECDS